MTTTSYIAISFTVGIIRTYKYMLLSAGDF